MLMRQVFKMEINTLKILSKKFGDRNTLIVSADIENQINELPNEERENYMEMIGLKKLV